MALQEMMSKALAGMPGCSLSVILCTAMKPGPVTRLKDWVLCGQALQLAPQSAGYTAERALLYCAALPYHLLAFHGHSSEHVVTWVVGGVDRLLLH